MHNYLLNLSIYSTLYSLYILLYLHNKITIICSLYMSIYSKLCSVYILLYMSNKCTIIRLLC